MQCRARLSAPLQGVCVRRCRPITCQSARRAVSAATFFSRPAVLRSERRYTPYFGAYRLSAAGTGRQCLPEIATGAKRPRNDNSGAVAILTAACIGCKCSAGPGCPRPYNGGCRAPAYSPIVLCSFFSAFSNSSGRGQESVISSPVRGCRNVSSFAWRHWECRPSSGLPMP